MVSAVDLAPTLAELCGLDPMTGTDGLSYACLLRGEQRAWPRTEAFSCFNYMNNHPEIDQRNPDFDPELAQRFDQYRPSRALNGGRFSYLWNGWADGNLTLPRTMLGEFHRMLGQGELEDSELRTFIEKRTVEELYDVRNDPACRNNLAGETEFSQTLSGFRNRMLQLLERTGDQEFKNFRKFLAGKEGAVLSLRVKGQIAFYLSAVGNQIESLCGLHNHQGMPPILYKFNRFQFEDGFVEHA